MTDPSPPVHDCPHCGPLATWEAQAHTTGCPKCGVDCPVTRSPGARLESWGAVLACVLGRLECTSGDRLLAQLDVGELEQLGLLCDWLQEEGMAQQVRERQPPLQLVRPEPVW